MNEIWKDIPEYEGYYEASNLGNIRSVIRGKLLKQTISPFGYFRVGLHKDGKPKSFGVHRLILATFTGMTRLEVNHIDGIKTNNRVENLEWVNRSQNMKHAARHGLLKTYRGSDHARSKKNKYQVFEIIDKYKTGKYTQMALASEYGVCQKTICNITTRKTHYSDLLEEKK